jgi:hypothetical protein
VQADGGYWRGDGGGARCAGGRSGARDRGLDSARSRAEDVLRAFGADPDRPESLRQISDDVTARMSIDPWVAVLEAGTAVLAVEYNGFQGADQAVLRRASAGGRAGMFWNVNALTRLSFAEGGQMLASFEPPRGRRAGGRGGPRRP